jgi:hypothetical protein
MNKKEEDTDNVYSLNQGYRLWSSLQEHHCLLP